MAVVPRAMQNCSFDAILAWLAPIEEAKKKVDPFLSRYGNRKSANMRARNFKGPFFLSSLQQNEEGPVKVLWGIVTLPGQDLEACPLSFFPSFTVCVDKLLSVINRGDLNRTRCVQGKKGTDVKNCKFHCVDGGFWQEEGFFH